MSVQMIGQPKNAIIASKDAQKSVGQAAISAPSPIHQL